MGLAGLLSLIDCTWVPLGLPELLSLSGGTTFRGGKELFEPDGFKIDTDLSEADGFNTSPPG